MGIKNLLTALFFGYLIMSLAACNKNTNLSEQEKAKIQENQKSLEAMYPHQKDFFKNHGAKFLGDKEQCLGCHGKDGVGGGTANVSCVQCHEAYPHVNFLAIPDQHAASYAKNPQSCAKCHGDDWGGGKTGVSCFKCHEGFPHAKKWANPDQHGKAFAGIKDRQQCLTCHDSKKPEAQATQCTTCHQAYPHDEDFKGGNKLHKKLAMGYEGQCLLCHRDYKANMPTYQDPKDGEGCIYCHTGKIEVQWKEEEKKEPQGSTGKLMNSKTRLPSSSLHQKNKKIKK